MLYAWHSAYKFEKIDNFLVMKKGRNVMYYYLVRDIISPIYFHQSTNIFLSKFGVMIIVMMTPQDLEKVG